MLSSIRLSVASAIVAVALAVPGNVISAPMQARSAASPAVPESRGFNVFSPEQDVQLGQQYSQEINQQLPVLPENNAISQYISRLGQSLVAQLPEHPYQYSFRVVQQKDINAFALPGGPIYINMGLIEAASNEAEVAGVIGHEIAHVHMRHSTRQASKQVLAQAPLAILGGVLGGSAFGQLAQMGIGFGVNSAFMKYSRDAESESDRVGTVLMYKAGYNPRSAADFFQKLQQEGGARGPEFLSSHPDPGNREAAIRQQSAGYPARSYRQNTAEFNRIKSQVAKTKSYTAEELAKNPPQGQSQDQGQTQSTRPAAADIKPAQSFRTFQHSLFRITYPQNWEVHGDRNSEGVTVAPRGAVSQNAISYGVILSSAPRPNASTLDSATRELVKGLQQSNPEMRQSGELENIRVNGVSAKSVELTGVSPLPENNGAALRERNWLVVLPRGNDQIFYAVFIAPEPDYKQLLPAFERMLRSLRLQQ